MSPYMKSTISPATASTMPMTADAAIGIFDSGIGGLSVLRHIHAALPHENLLYFADSGYAPYGDKCEKEIIDRSIAVTSFLIGLNIKALVVACNTATAASIQLIRERWPHLIVVGIEPGLKPAALGSTTRVVGVLATRSTLASTRFALLRQQIESKQQIHFELQACIGLVELIEKGELYSPAMIEMLERYLRPLLEIHADTLVLGCTHYPFVREAIDSVCLRLCGRVLTIIDTGEAVARQLKRQLDGHHLPIATGSAGTLSGYTTATRSLLVQAFKKLLALTPPVFELT